MSEKEAVPSIEDSLDHISGSLARISDSLEWIVNWLDEASGETDGGRKFIRNIDIGRE